MGPVSVLPRLKNKTMDEIITRWATDLSKYQKEFKEQAAKVSEWDRMLVGNGEKIQKLYTSTFEAERASHEIERQLASVESQQEELGAWLERYEQELDDLYSKQGGGANANNDQVAGPDQERERTYKLAEKLTDRLDDMGKDLTKMIKEINDMSGTLSKGNKPDDPVCFCSVHCRCLNAVLISLHLVEPNRSRLERPFVSVAVDRYQRCGVADKGHGRPKGYRTYGPQHFGPRDSCGRELLPVLQGWIQIDG